MYGHGHGPWIHAHDFPSQDPPLEHMCVKMAPLEHASVAPIKRAHVEMAPLSM